MPATLDALSQAIARCRDAVEIIVVDNNSTDATEDIARVRADIVVSERVRNIARVRNAGAAAATGDVLVFLDADTWVPDNFLSRISEVMRVADCMGGRPEIRHAPKALALRIYLESWRRIGNLLGMAQGASLFCRQEAFINIGGFDESQFMGEDVEFFWRLRVYARHHGGRIVFLEDIQVMPSARRFDQWPLRRTLLYTNPFFIAIFRRTESAWWGWYIRPVR